jgi:hypothetical protein
MRKMRQPQQSRRWFMGLFVLAIAGLLTACSSGSEGCGGVEDIVSCISVSSIQPIDTAGVNTSDVDVIQDPDCDNNPTTSDLELFTKHDALVTFTNAAFPNFIDPDDESESLAVTIERVRITYQVNNCPPLAGLAGCPPLPELNQAVSLDIPADSTVTGTFPLVPISTKDEFVALGGSADAFPSYTANYVFTARTQAFSDTFTVKGATNFVMGNFNVCP